MLAIIPARSGSKGVVNKNRRQLHGKPLIEWTLESALYSKSVSEILVSSDDALILANSEVVLKSNYLVKRPAEFSRDNSPATEYIKHALDVVDARNNYEYFCVLQPTSPLREANDIDSLFKRVYGQGANCGVTVTEVPHNFSPESLMQLEGDMLIPSTYTLVSSNLRQEKRKYYARNGAAVYICRVDHFYRENSLFSERMAFWPMSMLRSIDIDDEDDFKLAGLIMMGNLT